ncbi:site-specific integrase [Gemmata sp. G18]|uniref:Site-specific integrase n=1 Tax=Gemmata palustris TaxID=2822762 RepID=A0ABS5BVF7_9BACT|nr:site-specific integrase [Gemmata palustris]
MVEVMAAYLDHAECHYRDPDGNPSEELRHLKTALRYVRVLYGSLPVIEFGPLALKAVRQKFVDLKWSRKTVNARVERVRRMFEWGVAEELIPVSVSQALKTVKGLRQGRTTARETEPIKPVPDAVVDATLPHVNRHVAGLIEFQRLTGSRPGEACRVRRCDIDTTGNTWLYKPKRHKTAWKGKTRTIPIGPKAQTLLREFFTSEPTDYLFSPARAVEEFRAKRSANRKTPKYPSEATRKHARRAGAKLIRPPAARYNRLAYLTAITRGCDRAFPPVDELARREKESAAKWWARLASEQRVAVKEWRRGHHWHPNQLRHNYATRARKLFGLEGAQAVLGHAKINTTELYAEKTND